MGVALGTPIAVRVRGKEHIDAFKDFTAPTDGATPAPAAATPPGQLPPHTILTMPCVSPSPNATHGGIYKWLKEEGDKVEEGDGVVDVQTDKEVMTDVAQDEYYLAKILVPEG